MSDSESGDEAPAPAPAAGVAKDRSGMGKVFAAFDELKRKKLQKAVVEGMFALAEKKYGKKRPVHEKADKQDAMADFELYLRSIRAKVKTAEDKLNAIMKQKKDMDAKVAAAEKEHADKKKVVDDAEKEKDAAEKESRDPVLPKDFIIPKKLGASKAGLGALVMKASAGAWEDKFAAMRSKKQSGGKNPAWTQKKDKTSALLGVGTKKRDRSAKGTADFGAALKPKKKDATPVGDTSKKSEAERRAMFAESEVAKAPEPEPIAEPKPELEQEPETEPEKAPGPEPEPEPESSPSVKLVESEEDDTPAARRRRARRRQPSDSD